MKPFHVYLLRCGDGSYYCGQTDDLEARLHQHEHAPDGYTATRKPFEVVWQGEFETREQAIAFEQRVKGWSRAKKEALIRGDWDAIQVLAWGTRNPLPERLQSSSTPALRSPSIPQGERVVGSPSIPQGERLVGSPSIPQDERLVGSPSIPQDERVSADASPLSVRPEVSKGSARPGFAPDPSGTQDGIAGGPSIPQDERLVGSPSIPQDERVSADVFPLSVRPEVSKGLSRPEPSLQDRITQSIAPAVQRRAIAKAITLLESTRADHRAQGDELLTALLPRTGNSFRLGISGVPGVGKSTFIEVLGLYLISQGHRVAVLTIDPSSTVSGGSILGDKTRMEQLSVHERAYIRPSPSSGTLGGVAEKTREAMLVCEAAGYDVVIVETVGVGQSETAVANMTDMFVLMQLPNAGDDLQAIKKGVMELADLVVINKADIDADAAMRAEGQIKSAMRLFGLVNNAMGSEQAKAYDQHWHPQVLQLSALHNRGVDAFWAAVTEFKTLQTANGQLAGRRQQQALAWMWERIDAGLKQAFRQDATVGALLPGLMAQVARGQLPASTAARQLLGAHAR